jgi:hypothetical protein
MSDTDPSTEIQFARSPSGEWAARAPADKVRLGPVTVIRRDGTSQEVIVIAVSKAFVLDGIGAGELRYGYLAPRPRPPEPGTNCPTCGRRVPVAPKRPSTAGRAQA